MSGSSALASARRRRAESTPQTIASRGGQPIESTETRKEEDLAQRQVSTPLQILQEHDKKIKHIEENLEKNIVEISKKVLAENLKHFNLDKPQPPPPPPQPQVKEFDSKPIIDKINTLTSNFDELKTLVIKSQDTNNEGYIQILKFKDKLLSLEENILQLQLQINETKESNDNIFNMEADGAAEMLLRSMMQSSIIGNAKDGKLNIHENESDEDSNDIGEISEITLTENELDSLKNEVKSVLVEETIKPTEINSEEKIEVSENEEDHEQEREN
jgi:hypothetical protein